MGQTRSHGVIAAGHDLTAQAGADVLRDGGTAFDAAIAALAMACVCEPILCSPGGGGFAMVRDGRSGEISLLDFFPHTPLERHRAGDGGVQMVFADFGTTTQGFHIGPATTATPGFVNGLRGLRGLGASRALSELVEPAVTAARSGVVITPFQHHLSTVVTPIITATDAVADLFAPGGRIPAPGELSRNPGLADALEVVASDAPANAVDHAILATQREGGHLTERDLDAYDVITREPLMIDVGTAGVAVNPLPAASGTLIAHSLQDQTSWDPLAYADALDATDRERRNAGHDLAAMIPAPIRQKGTTHVSVIDADGTVCAVTVSNGEGNGRLVDGFGFMLNNVLGEEDVNPAGATGWPTDTRLSSMMCPTIIEERDGGVIALGSGGSNRIRSAIGQVVARLCFDGADLVGAVDAPRLHVEHGHLDFEDRFGDAVGHGLRAAFEDHRAWPQPNLFFGGVHAVRMGPDGGFSAVGDARRDGTAIVV